MTLLDSRFALLVLAFYSSMSGAAFVAFAVDKRSARRRGWRIKEQTLHCISLAGGWPGMWAGIFALRHKSSKRSFKSALFFISVLHVLGWVYIFMQSDL